MQTFLPLPEFGASARCLEWRRLGKQRVECKQILNALVKKRENIKAGWQHHPAVLMWEGYEDALCVYGYLVCEEWSRRGYRDTLRSFFISQLTISEDVVKRPWWLGDERLHSSHRARLLQKDPTHYSQFGWREEPCGPDGYFWPGPTPDTQPSG